MDRIIAFLKETPSFVKEYKNGGQFNGYLLIPKEYYNIEFSEPHGGITISISDSKRIKEFIDNSVTYWEYGNLEHPDYSKYFCIGFDTLHFGIVGNIGLWKESGKKFKIGKEVLSAYK